MEGGEEGLPSRQAAEEGEGEEAFRRDTQSDRINGKQTNIPFRLSLPENDSIWTLGFVDVRWTDRE